MDSYRERFNAAAEGDLRGLAGDVGCLTIADYILRRAALPKAARLLDLGCGDGGVLKAIARLRPDLECVGVDFAGKLIERAMVDCPPKVTFHMAEIAAGLPEGLGAFDHIVSFSVLQYLAPPEITGLCGKLRSRLKPGGRIAHLSVPDLSKRLVMFHDSYLNTARPRNWVAGKLNLLHLAMVDLKRQITGDRSYSDNGFFHDGEELAARCSEQFEATVMRPSDSWYRFDLLLDPK
jgi:trans-aconitate methyltransferase